MQWFTPPPWRTIYAETDVRPGGASYIVMKGPDGTEMPNRGVYLEVVKNEKIVFTDAYESAWVPVFSNPGMNTRIDKKNRKSQRSVYEMSARSAYFFSTVLSMRSLTPRFKPLLPRCQFRGV